MASTIDTYFSQFRRLGRKPNTQVPVESVVGVTSLAGLQSFTVSSHDREKALFTLPLLPGTVIPVMGAPPS